METRSGAVPADPAGALRPGIALPPDVRRHVEWLLSGPIRLPGGLVAAWTEDGAPAHPYEEATGYLATLACFLYRLTGDPRFLDHAGNLLTALARSVADRPGCGRGGRVYLFDTAVCLRAVGAFFDACPEACNEAASEPVRFLGERLLATTRRMVRARTAVLGPNGAAGPPRWSETWNVHLTKVFHPGIPVLHADTRPGLQSDAEEVLGRRYHDGLFHAEPPPAPAYLHAHCYAVEGLLTAGGKTHAQYASVLRETAARLAQIQLPDGGLPSHWPTNGRSTAATDATAQAVRIWQCVDAGRFRAAIGRGLSFLGAMAEPGGGFRYAPHSRHVNSWTTIFAVQAFLWRDLPAEPGWII